MSSVAQPRTALRPALAGRPLGLAAEMTFYAVIAAFPLLSSNQYYLFLAAQAGIYYLAALGLNLLSGYGGQALLGQGALIAIGAYTTAIGMVDHDQSFWVMLPLAVLVTAAAGALMALPALRLSAWYFALLTLGFANVVAGFCSEWRDLTHGFAGIIGVAPPSLFGADFGPGALYWLVAGIAVLAFLATRNIVTSRYGIALQALRDNPLAAMGSGISLIRLRIFAFLCCATMAGLAGALLAVLKTVITPDDFPADFSIFFLLVVVLGGIGRLHGPLLGTLAFFVVPQLLDALQTWRLLVYGVALLLLILFVPDGLSGLVALAFRSRRAAPPVSADDVAVASVQGSTLAVTGVAKRFGGVMALNDVGLVVPPGTTHAIVGPNGSGKTTLLNLISGYYSCDAGSITVDGAEARNRAASLLARRGIRRTFQTPKLINGLSVLENVMLGGCSTGPASVAEVILHLPRAEREMRARRALAMRYLNFVGAAEYAARPAGDIPHGQQRLVEIARALLGSPTLLLLDEPAAGLSLLELDRLRDLIKAIAALGTTTIIVEHHLDLVADLCQSVTVLDRGSILAAGTPAEVFVLPEVISAYMGTRAVAPIAA